MRRRFADAIVALAGDPTLAFLTGDLGYMALEPVRDALGTRFLNAGVAEQNMISVAAGLARTGLRPWAYSIAPFLYARPFEQVRNDVCLHRLPVRLAGNGGGYGYGVMGATHHALEDYGALLTLDAMTVLVPAFGADVATARWCWCAAQSPERFLHRFATARRRCARDCGSSRSCRSLHSRPSSSTTSATLIAWWWLKSMSRTVASGRPWRWHWRRWARRRLALITGTRWGTHLAGMGRRSGTVPSAGLMWRRCWRWLTISPMMFARPTGEERARMPADLFLRRPTLGVIASDLLGRGARDIAPARANPCVGRERVRWRKPPSDPLGGARRCDRHG
jgi:hypothetical protein